jgi:long-chain acyl-CoA synthetase
MNLAAIVDSHPADRTALVERDRVVTYGELRDRVAAIRGGLARRGIGPGQPVALVGANGIAFVEAYLALLGRGAIVVPLNPESPPTELDRERAAVGATEVIAAGAGELEELASADPAPLVDLAPGAVAVLAFTSGTAGAPKAAILTHASLLANIDQMLAGPDRIQAGDVVLGVLPIFHIFGLGVALDLTLAVGASLVLVPRFEAIGTLELVREAAVTIVPGVPTMWAAWAHLPDASPTALSSVRHAVSGAAKLPDDVFAAIERRFGVVLREGYGLTEASPAVTTSVGIEPRRGSVGRALDGVDVRLVEADGIDALAGDPGEIWVRGANVFAGYWHDAEATARVLTPEGWLRTGDVAVVDDDGYLYLVDRVKDLIIVSGFNVYPAEVEEAITEAPGVAEASVVGIPSESTGEAVRAYVVPTAAGVATVTEDGIAAWCRQRLARYKCPTSVVLVDELPKGATGKVLRRSLR